MENPTRSARADDGTATVTVAGEIDYSNADDLSQAIRDALAEWSPSTIRVDLKDATFIDSTGLGALIEGYRSATDAQSRLTLINPTAGFRRVLRLTGLGDLLGVEDEPSAVDLTV